MSACPLCGESDGVGDCVNKGHPEFYRILGDMAALHAKKAADYGSDEDPLHNVRSGGEFANIPAWVAAMLRANDKMVRLRSLIRNGKLENESAEDSLLDIACYAIIAAILAYLAFRGAR